MDELCRALCMLFEVPQSEWDNLWEAILFGNQLKKHDVSDPHLSDTESPFSQLVKNPHAEQCYKVYMKVMEIREEFLKYIS